MRKSVEKAVGALKRRELAFLAFFVLVVLALVEPSWGALSGGTAMKEIGKEVESTVRGTTVLLKVAVLAFYLIEFFASVKVAKNQYDNAVQQGRAQEGGMWKTLYYVGGVVLGIILVAITSKLVSYATGSGVYTFQSLFNYFLGR